MQVYPTCMFGFRYTIGPTLAPVAPAMLSRIGLAVAAPAVSVTATVVLLQLTDGEANRQPIWMTSALLSQMAINAFFPKYESFPIIRYVATSPSLSTVQCNVTVDHLSNLDV